MRMKFTLALVLIFISKTSGNPPKILFDDGLKKACEQKNGVYKQRASPDANVGDTCKMRFFLATDDAADAWEYCVLHAPWRVKEATRGVEAEKPYVDCSVEATYMCESGWIQIFGKCFQMPQGKKPVTYEQAKQICGKKNNGKIAKLSHEYIVGVWKNYFVDIRQIWVQADPSYERFVQKTDVDGSAFAIAFTGKHRDFAVKPNALIKIDPSIRLQVMCQYTPMINKAEISYRAKRYSEIYYPIVNTDDGLLIRTASSYVRGDKNQPICREMTGFLNPIRTGSYDTNKQAIVSSANYQIGPFIPDAVALKDISDSKPKSLSFSRSGAEVRLSEKMQQKTCQYMEPRFEILRGGETRADYLVTGISKNDMHCDNELSAGIDHFGQAKLLPMSDSISAPMWCELGCVKKYEYTVPEGYTVYDRSNGKVVAHKLFTAAVNYVEAARQCGMDHAKLSGINSLKESEALTALVKKAGLSDMQFWIGGKRRKECENVIGFKENPNDPCYRNNVIEWTGEVATLFWDDWWKDMVTGKKNPDYASNLQSCLSFVSGTPKWADPNSKGFLDDIQCTEPLGFFCTKDATVVEIKECT